MAHGSSPHSLQRLMDLYPVLLRNYLLSDCNQEVIVDSLATTAEILIWGDQNDSSVLEFFSKKDMLCFFPHFLRQCCGEYGAVCIQILEMLNNLIASVRNEIWMDYLLSSGHIKWIIKYKFDFTDNRVMAYYISFLHTMSRKLNARTIPFFYNKQTSKFSLYTEAIKYFNHPELLVRSVVRTITLTVFTVEDASVTAFLLTDGAAAPYFSNVVELIGKHVQALDTCVRNDADREPRNRLSDLVAEHLDHLRYLNTIFCLNKADLNQALTDRLLHKVLIPLCVNTMQCKRDMASHCGDATSSPASGCRGADDEEFNANVSGVVALFLLSQIFLLISHPPLIRKLTWFLLKTDHTLVGKSVDETFERYERTKDETENAAAPADANSSNAPVVSALLRNESDYDELYTFCLLYAIAKNKSVTPDLIEHALPLANPMVESSNGSSAYDGGYVYNKILVDRILHVMAQSSKPQCRRRLATLELGMMLLGQLVASEDRSGSSVG